MLLAVKRRTLAAVTLAACLAGAMAACGLSVSGADGTASSQDGGGGDGTVGGGDGAQGDDVTGGDDSAVGQDGTSGSDAADDVNIADVLVTGDGGFLDVQLDSDAGTATCPTGQYACGPLCVTDCADCFGAVGCPIGNVCVPSCEKNCGGNTTACFECNGGNPVATCQPFATATCLQGAYVHCGCNAVSPCPGETFCAGKPNHTACFSCGENGSNDRICGASAGKCVEATGVCK